MYETIVPDKCNLFLRNRLELQLTKQKPGICWRTLHDEKVCILYVHTYHIITNYNKNQNGTCIFGALVYDTKNHLIKQVTKSIIIVKIMQLSRFTIVSREAKKKQAYMTNK